MRRPATVALLVACALLPVAAPRVVFAQGRSGAETEEEQTFANAEAAFQANRFDEAAPLYEKVLALNPARADAYVKRSVIFYKKKDFSSAVALLRKAQEILPEDLGIKAQLGLSLYRSGAQELAVGMMEEVVQKSPQSYQVQLQLGQHYLKVSNGKRATESFESYFKYRPEEAAVADAQYLPGAGMAYLINKQYDEAQKDFDAALRANPKDFLSRLGLAAVYTAGGDCPKAIALYEKMIGDAARQPSIHFNLGTCYLSQNRRAEAERQADAYTKARPKERMGWVLLGDAKYQNRDYAGALAAFQTAQKLEPENQAVTARVGKVYVAQKNYQAALLLLEPASHAHPDDLDVLTQLAEAYAVTRVKDKELLTTTAERLTHASNEEALTASGVAYYVAGEDGLAEKSFAAALIADPHALRARSGQQIALNHAASRAVEHGDLALAEELLTKAQSVDVESVQTNRNLGLVLLLEKKYPEAEKALQLALKRVSRDLVVNRLLGRLHAEQGHKAEALKYYQAAEAVASRARGPVLAQVYAEMGPLYVELGKLDEAVSVLETAAQEAGPGGVLAAAQRNLALAYYRRGIERLRDGRQADAAAADLDKALHAPAGALVAREKTAVECAYAAAALRANKLAAAQEAWATASRGGGCQLAPPYDRVGIDFFTAYLQYRDPRDPARRETVARTLQKLMPKATGNLVETMKELVRSDYELEGAEWFTRGDAKRSAAALRAAQKIATRADRRTLDHNLAVLDLNDGKLALAERAFDQLGAKPPEALLNLGIVRDRQGDSRKALELYRKAQERGVRAPRLKEWIDVKERLLSAGGSAAATGGNR